MEKISGKDWRRYPVMIEDLFVYPLGLFIKGILTKEDEVNPYEIYKRIQTLKLVHENMPRFNYDYQYVRNIFYYLSQLGLITFSRVGASSKPGLEPKRYYRLTPEGRKAENKWFNPLEEYRKMRGHL